MALFKKLDLWSIQEELEKVVDSYYDAPEKKNQYWDYYSEQINEMGIIAADMMGELMDIKNSIWYKLPAKKVFFCPEDECTQTGIAWFNTAACMLSDTDMTVLLENEGDYTTDDEKGRELRIKALGRLTKEQQMWLYTTVIGFITRFLELMAAYETITAVIRELDYHQSAINGKNGVSLPDSAYV